MPIVKPGIKRFSGSTNILASLDFTSTIDILTPTKGTGTATFTRASAVYFTDYQGEVQSMASGYPAIEGSRKSGNSCLSTDTLGVALPQSYLEWQASTAYAAGAKIQVAGWWYTASAGTSAASAPTWLTGKAGLVTVTDNDITWTLGGRLLQGYVSEPASTNKTTAYGIIPADTLGSELSSGTLTIGQKYQITARTDADFTADGSVNNTVGTQFVATAATVTLDAGDKVKRVQWGVGEKSYHNGTAFVQNITGITLSGDVAAVLSIVTDETEIVKAGLANINPTYKVYKLDNSLGAITAYTTHDGTVGNTNVHTLSAVVRGEGVLFGGASGDGFIAFNSSPYAKVNKVITPSTTTRKNVVYAAATKIVYFLLPGLEEQPFATSINPSLGATSTRAATVLSYPVTGNIPTTGPWTMKIGFISMGVPTAERMIFSSYTDADNYTRFSWTPSTLTFRKRIAGTNYDATKALTIVPNTLYNAVIRRNTDGSLDLFCQGAKGTGTADTTTPVLSTAFQVGSSNSVSQFGGWIQSATIYRKALSDSECITLAP